jgi:hypothetical protein
VDDGPGLLDLVSRREVEGQVVRRRSYSQGNDKLAHFMAVDSGRSDKVRAWLVPAAVYGRFREGEVVRATIGPRLGHVFGVELVTEGRAPSTVAAPGEPAEDGPEGAGADMDVERVAAGLTGMGSRRETCGRLGSLGSWPIREWTRPGW